MKSMHSKRVFSDLNVMAKVVLCGLAISFSLVTSAAEKKSTQTAAAATELKVASSDSKVTWIGTKVAGEHNGTIGVESGTVMMDSKGMIQSGTIAVDMNQIVCDDLTDAGYNKKLVDHLKSEDFFDVANHPVAKFEIKKVSGKKDNQKLEGELTIRGKTEKVSLPVKVTEKDGVFTAAGELELDRTKFGLVYNSAKNKMFDIKKFADKIIHDKFKLGMTIVAKK